MWCLCTLRFHRTQVGIRIHTKMPMSTAIQPHQRSQCMREEPSHQIIRSDHIRSASGLSQCLRVRVRARDCSTSCAGTIARTCAATGVGLHLVGPLGFEIDSSRLKRAGLDYWPYVAVDIYSTWQASLHALC